MFAEAPDAFLRDFGSPVIFGAYKTLALFDQPDMDVLGGRAQSTQYRIEYPSSALPGLVNNSVVLVGITPGWTFSKTGTGLYFAGANPGAAVSAQFRVMGTPNLVDDGLFVEARLQRIAATQTDHLLTEDGQILTTESGQAIDVTSSGTSHLLTESGQPLTTEEGQDLDVTDTTNHLLAEGGQIINTEDGQNIGVS